MKIAVISGSGAYPEILVRNARRFGVERVDVLAIRGSASRLVRSMADESVQFGMGEISTALDWIASRGYDGVVLAGQVSPISLFRTRFDEATRRWLSEIGAKNAHSLFGKLVEKFEEKGVKVLPASYFMDDCIPGEGVLTERDFTDGERRDIEHAAKVAADMGIHDVGQTVLVKGGMVLAVEAFEGTNAAIRRAGSLGGRGAVVFKAARRGHDMRFDIPVIGLKTLKVMKRAGVTALGFQAGRIVVLEREKVVKFANRHSIAIAGVATDLPPAPLRP